MRNFIHTSNSVTEGHPDKLCDAVSDAVVDAYLALDEAARVVVECAISTSIVFIACHAAASLRPDLAQVARRVITDAGYEEPDLDPGAVPVMATHTDLPPGAYSDSPGAALEGRDLERVVAGHNVTTFGYACSQTPERMPLPVVTAHRLARALSEARRDGRLPWLGPDCQAQVTLRFEDRRPVELTGVTLLVALLEEAPEGDALSTALRETVIHPALDETARTVAALTDADLGPGALAFTSDTRLLVNPRGAFIPGGPRRHAGVTGRKLGVDTYGDYSRQPSSALSGKDPTRIDRAATYAARYLARNVVAAGLAGECEIQLSYTIGQARAASLEVDTLGTGKVPDEQIGRRLRAVFDSRPAAIERRLGLTRGVRFERLAVYGHLGRSDLELPWEREDLAAELG